MQHLFPAARIMPIQREVYQHKNVEVAVLRLDEIHPVISGNKWFKLKRYLKDAAEQHKKAVLTFGGAYSNHIIATAAMCSIYNIQSVGVIRGEKPDVLSPTLSDAVQHGMRLFFVSRDAYKKKIIPSEVYGLFKEDDIYEISEGGYGTLGMQGSMDILKSFDAKKYTHIIAAVGSGTMLSGLINAAAPHQEVIGISVLKNNFTVENAVQKLLFTLNANFQILHDFHFGGYAKHTLALLKFMNAYFAETGIPTDFVYTAKTFYAADHLIGNDFFKEKSSLLLIQSGGLQGNRSLPAGMLRF